MPININYQPFRLQKNVHDSKHRIRTVAFGRRSGKSIMALIEGLCMSTDAVKLGVTKPRGFIAAPTNEMLRENWYTANTLLKEAITKSQISEHRLSLGIYGIIDFKSTEAQGGATRGGGYDWGVLDEAARIPKDAWEGDMRPSLSDRFGRALIISTPTGLNWFYDMYRLGQEDDPDFMSWHASTLDCWRSRFTHKPELLKQYEKEWELLKRSTSESVFREEYMAEFLAGEGQHFTLKDGLYRGSLRSAVPGNHYIAGVDVAAKEDWMVTAIIEIESQQLVGLIRSRHKDWSIQKSISMSLIRQYPQCLTYIDSTGVGDPIAQDYRDAGINAMDVIFTPKMKKELVENLTIAIEQCYLGIPKEKQTQWLIDELQCYEAIKSASGIIRYQAPEGKHDDGVTALMLACRGLQGQWKQPMSIDNVENKPWYETDDPWKHLDYEHKLKQYRNRFPTDLIPAHPTDLAWSKFNG